MVPRLRGSGLPLRLVLTVPFVVQVLGLVGIVGYLSYRSGKNAVNELAYQLMAESSDRITSDLNAYLHSAHQINRANIAALESGVVNLQDLDQLQRYMILQHRQLPAVTTLLLGTPEGEFRTIHRISATAAATGLSDVKPTELPYEAGRSDAADPSRFHLYTINEAGQLERYAGTLENIDVRDRPWYRRAAETGQPGWSEPFQIGASNELTINGYTPFYEASQRFAGVFSVNLALERLNDFLAEHAVSKSGQVFIVERNGQLLANSTGELPFTSSHIPPPLAPTTPPVFLPGEITFHRLSMATSANPVIRATSQAIMTQVGDLDTIRSAQNLAMVIRDETQAESLGCRQTVCQPYFLRITPYQDAYGLDWLIVTVVPQSDFMGAINANVHRTLMLCGVALVGAIGLGIWTTRRIARSLSRLTQATQRVAAGNLDTMLPHTRIAEVEMLTTAFRQMALELGQAAQLQQHYAQNLEQQVAEKTAALTEAQRIARVGSWEVDVVTGVSTWSAEQYRILGIEPTADLPHYPDILALISPEDQPLIRAAVETAIAQGTPYTVEHGIIRPDQSIGYVISRGEGICNALGEVVKLVGTITDITDRKRAEIALQESEIKFSGIFHASPDPAWIATLADGKILNANHRFSLFLGYDITEIVGKTCRELNLWPSREDFERFHQALVTTGKLEDFEVELRLKSGELRTVLMSAVVNRIDHEDCVIGILKDISDRKALELALKSSEANLSNILNSAIAAITRMQVFEDGQWTITHISDGCEAVSSYTAAELIADQALWVRRIYPEDWAAISPQIFADIFAENSGTYEYRISDQAENLRWISQTNRSGWDADQGCWLVTAVSFDITARKQVEEQLHNSKAALIEAQRMAHIGNWALDLQTQKITWSQELFRMFGVDPAQPEPAYGDFLQMLHPDDRIRLQQQVEKAIADGQPYLIEYRVRQPDGSLCYHEGRAEVELDAEGNVVQLFGTAMDITERKQAEAALTQAKQQLEIRIIDLNQRNQEMESLGKMSDFLQACLTLTDIYETLPSLLQPLFPGCSGSLFSVDPAVNQAQVVATWGTHPPSITTLPIEDCWALRRGKDRRDKPEVPALRCHHISCQDTATLCIPMIAQGETLGLFYITVDGPEAFPESKQQLAHTVAEQVSLAIANLQLRKTLRQQSIRDALTGLYNRRYLEESLTQAIAQAQRHDQAIGVIMLDIDHFKQFNDTYGHPAGDHVLQTVGELLSARMRGSDIACRYGGEEMTLILPESSLAQAQLKAETIRRAIARLELTYNGQHLGVLTASLGVASFPQHGATVSALVQAADAALYCAKASGRNQVVVAPS